jgi:molybdate transport system ATP-binding protein
MHEDLKFYAIEGTNLSMKDEWIQALLRGEGPVELEGISGRKGLLFSTITLEKFIEEEFRHDRFDLSGESQRSIRSFSSGEQRKALLEYQIKQDPGFLILDNPFDALDTESVTSLKKRLTALAKTTPIIQIFKRRKDLLPCISHVVIVEEEQLKKIYSLREYLEKHLHREQGVLTFLIPPPPSEFENTPEILVEMKKVSVSYGERIILRDIDWTIRRSEFWQLTGLNGSGKTTLLTMITGDNPKAYGVDLFLFGRKKGSGESVWEIKKKIGYFTSPMTELFQRNNTVEQMVISGLLDTVGLYRKATGRQLELAGQWLRAVGIDHLKDTSFLKLSQVHQRMVLIVRAMIKHPPLLILDEPSTGLDDHNASLLTELINKIAAESNTAIIYVSHRKEEGLQPGFIYRLVPSKKGSSGKTEML